MHRLPEPASLNGVLPERGFQLAYVPAHLIGVDDQGSEPTVVAGVVVALEDFYAYSISEEFRVVVSYRPSPFDHVVESR